MSNEIIGQRLAEWRNSRPLSQRALAAALEVSQGFISDIEKGRVAPSRNFLQALYANYRVNPAWILEGQKPVILTVDRSLLGVPMSDYVQVRYWPLGDNTPLEQPGEVAFLNSWLRERTYSPGDCYLLCVPDDRMAPTIPAGAVVMFDHSQKSPRDDGLFVLCLDDGIHIRRLRQIGKQWLVECDNRAYPDRLTLSKKEDLARIEGQVLWQSSILTGQAR